MEYRPSAFEVAVRTLPVALFVAVTVALGITAPVSSVMLPLIMPVGACARTLMPQNRSAASNINTDTTFNIEENPFPDSRDLGLTQSLYLLQSVTRLHGERHCHSADSSLLQRSWYFTRTNRHSK